MIDILPVMGVAVPVVLAFVAVGSSQAADQCRQVQDAPMFAQTDWRPQGPGPGRMHGGMMGKGPQ